MARALDEAKKQKHVNHILKSKKIKYTELLFILRWNQRNTALLCRFGQREPRYECMVYVYLFLNRM